jgi:hypothetical protein
MYEGVPKSFRAGRLERELQMVQLSATRSNCIAILWVSLVSFVAIILCVASQLVFIVVRLYFVIDSVLELFDTPSYLNQGSGGFLWRRRWTRFMTVNFAIRWQTLNCWRNYLKWWYKAPSHENVWGEWRYSSTNSYPRHYMQVNGQFHAPSALHPEKEFLVPIG